MISECQLLYNLRDYQLVNIQNMKKGGKERGSKKPKQRKVIEIKQSRQISPVKEVTEPEESRVVEKIKKPKFIISALPKFQARIPVHELSSVCRSASSLRTGELMKAILNKQQTEMNAFLSTCPPIFKKAFDKVFKKVNAKLNFFLDERVSRMNKNTVVYLEPDKDQHEKQKSRTLDNWIKQLIQVHENKKNFVKISQNYEYLLRDTEKKISKMSIEVPKQRIEPKLQQIAHKIQQNNQAQVGKKAKEVKQKLFSMFQTADNMRKIRKTLQQQIRRTKVQKEFAKKMQLVKKKGSHTLALFGVEDYLMI